LGGILLQVVPAIGQRVAIGLAGVVLLFTAAFHYTYHSEFYRLIAPDGDAPE
jgi:hypothetical protein